MAVKHFCDLCGEPALPNAYHYTAIRAPGSPKEFYIDAGFYILTSPQPRTSDHQGDVCPKCMIRELEEIISRIKARAEATCNQE